jgi:hypothetical protein
MNNLIPEKRVNKNGVAVTKHVRAAAKTASAAKVPAPSLKGSGRAKPAKTKPLTKKQLEPNYNTLIRGHFVADGELAESLRLTYGNPRMNQIYQFTCSDAEIYDVISVAGLKNAGALLDAGFRDKDSVTTYLRRKGLDRLIEDESELVRSALNRGVPSQWLFGAYSKRFTSGGNTADTELLLDSAEARSHKGLREAKCTPTIPDSVAAGTISMDDIRTIGATRFLKALEPNGFLLSQLAEIKSGTVDYGAEQIKETIERFTDAKGAVNSTSVRGVFAVARVGGYEEGVKLKYPALSSPFVRIVEGTVEEKLAAVQYAETVLEGVMPVFNISTQLVYKPYQAGATTEQAIDYIKGNITLDQIIAINDHGIAPSVSEGWL